ncbi:MAG: hypothetical protein GX111_08850 [Clostridiales bacterium]|nr:hypothetical protein [Clostridiales bacterium]
MISQTRSELYKLFRSLILLIMMLFLVVFNIFASSRSTDAEPIYSYTSLSNTFPMVSLDAVKRTVGLPDSQAEDLYELSKELHPLQFRYVMHKNLAMLLFTMIFAPFYIGMDFKSRAFNNAIYVGRSRSVVYLSRVVTYFIAAALMAFLSALLLTVFNATSVFHMVPSSYIWRSIFLRVLLDMGIMSVPMLFAFLFRGPFFSGLGALIYSLSNVIAGPAEKGILSYDPNSIKQLPGLWTIDASPALLTKAVLVSLGFIAVCTFLGWVSFRKMQLK